MKHFEKLFVAGTFDHFHAGHQFFLWSAHKMCDEMVIIIARDSTVKRIKGKNPLYTEEERFHRVKAENIPKAIVRLGREDGDFFHTLREEMPNGLLLGYDQLLDEEAVRKRFPLLEIMRAKAYKSNYFKSSKFGKEKRQG